jgi:2-hydroxy-3-keto-5-methylthiopentenyl-1-phosphate phosphatase
MRIICDFDGAITRQDGGALALKLIDVRLCLGVEA